MGRSAKVHKRTQKKTKSSFTTQVLDNTSTSISNNLNPSPGPHHHHQVRVQTAKKRAGLKDKISKSGPGRGNKDSTGSGISSVHGDDSDNRVLGGADYVSLLLGSRRKAREEAGKLPIA